MNDGIFELPKRNAKLLQFFNLIFFSGVRSGRLISCFYESENSVTVIILYFCERGLTTSHMRSFLDLLVVFQKMSETS
jgi:hypothetical protein